MPFTIVKEGKEFELKTRRKGVVEPKELLIHKGMVYALYTWLDNRLGYTLPRPANTPLPNFWF